MGKGDKPRPVDKKKFDSCPLWNNIGPQAHSKKKENVVPEEEWREVKMWEVDLDLEDNMRAELVVYAKENIDEDSLINWAATDILKKVVDKYGD